MPDRRSFLRSSTAALAGIFLGSGTSFGISTNNLAFTGGNWFDGRGFSRRTFYSSAGYFTSRKPGRIDQTIDLKNWFIVPPFGEAHNHNVDFSSEEQWSRIKEMYLRNGIFYAKNPMNLKRAATPLAGRINIPSSLDVSFAHAGLTVTDGHPMGLIKRNIERGGMLPSDIDGGFAWLIDTQEDLNRKWPKIVAEKPDFIKTILVYSEEYEKRKSDPKYFSWKGLKLQVVRQHLPHVGGERALFSETHLNGSSNRGYDRDLALRRKSRVTFRDSVTIEIRITGGRVVVLRSKSRQVVNLINARSHGMMKIGCGFHVRRYAQPGTVCTSRDVRQQCGVLHRHGVKIAIGSDSFRQTSQPEALAIHRLGAFDSLTLLKLWCENTAWTIFPKRRIGHLKEGYEASFVALADDPLKDFANVKRIELRVKQGTIL